MARRRSQAMVFISGVALTALVLVVLMATGVLPVKTQTTTVVTKQQTAAGATETSSTASDALGASDVALTPAQIYQRDSSGVVEVVSTLQTTQQSLFGPVSGETQALGSGFVVSTQGYILTNAHVVSDDGRAASKVTVVFKGAGSQTTRVAARIVGIDETSDVAVLKVDPAKAPTLNPLELGRSSTAQVGEPVVAIGNPLGYDFSLTSGIVSATDRNLQSPNGSTISNGIQTDAAINEGNSGGPLIDSSGKVIGINEQIASQSGGNQGLGFAVPIDTAAAVMAQIEKTGKATYAWLGVSGQTVCARHSQGARPEREPGRARGPGGERQPGGQGRHRGRPEAGRAAGPGLRDRRRRHHQGRRTGRDQQRAALGDHRRTQPGRPRDGDRGQGHDHHHRERHAGHAPDCVLGAAGAARRRGTGQSGRPRRRDGSVR